MYNEFYDDIQLLLRKYQATDTAEEIFLKQMHELLLQENSLRRNHLNPGHFTASAFVLSPDCKKLALIQHATLGKWLQPGGHIEPEDRSLDEACRREVQEETAIIDMELLHEGIFDIDIHHIPANMKKNECAHAHYDIRMLYRAKQLMIAAQAEVNAAQFVDFATIVQKNTDVSLQRVLKKIQVL
jgi:8-oxo-dGTP pyrophosphatase MutT (NUDIX family)